MKKRLIAILMLGGAAGIAQAVPVVNFSPSPTGDYKNECAIVNASLAVNSDFTWEAWVKIPASAAGLAENRLFGQTDWISEGRIILEVRNHSTTGGVPKFAVLYRVGGANQRLIAAPEIKADTWTHVAVTRTAATLTIYVNGHKAGEESLFAGLTPSAKFVIAPGFQGQLSDVRVWNTARTEAEIASAKDLRELDGATTLIGRWCETSLPSGIQGYNVTADAKAYLDEDEDRIILKPADTVIATGETRALKSSTDVTGLMTVRNGGVLDLNGIGNTVFRLRLEDGAKFVNNTANLGGNLYQVAGGLELSPGATAVFEGKNNIGFRADNYEETSWNLNGGTLDLKGPGLVYYSNVRNTGSGTIRYTGANNYLMDYTLNVSGSNDFANVTIEIGPNSIYQISFANVLGSLIGSGRLQYKNATLNGKSGKYAQAYVKKTLSGLLTFVSSAPMPVKILSGGTLDLTKNTSTYALPTSLTFGDEAIIDVRGRSFADGELIMSWSKNPFSKYTVLGLPEDQMAIATANGLVIATSYKAQVSGAVNLSEVTWTPALPEGYDVETTVLVVESTAPGTVITHDLALAKANLKVICSSANPSELHLLGEGSYVKGSTSRFVKAGDGCLTVSRSASTENVGGNLIENGEYKCALANHYAISGGHLAVMPGATLDLNQSVTFAKIFMMDGSTLKNSGGGFGANTQNLVNGIELARDAHVTFDLAYNAGIRSATSSVTNTRELRLNGGTVVKKGPAYFLCSAVKIPDEGTFRVEEGSIFAVANATHGIIMENARLELIGKGGLYIGHTGTKVGTISGTGTIQNTLSPDELTIGKGLYGTLSVSVEPLNVHLADGATMSISSGTPALGTLTLDGAAVLRAEDGVRLAFADSSAASWVGPLSVYAAPKAVSFGTSKAGLTAEQIAKINFNNGKKFVFSGYGALVYPGLLIMCR